MEVYTGPVSGTANVLFQIWNILMLVVPAVVGVIILVLAVKALRKYLREKESNKNESNR